MLIRCSCLLLLALFSGCGMLRPAIPGSGVSLTHQRQVPPFQAVDLSGFGNVNVHVGQPASVWVTTDDNLVEHVETSVEQGRLTIRTNGRIRPRKGLNIDVAVPHLSEARISGAGDLNVINAVGESLDLSISGAGTMTASGCVGSVTTSIKGAGDADLQQLIAGHVDVRITGAGDARVYASESIRARVSGAGDIHCYGNPGHVDQQVAGAGDFILESSPATAAYSFGDATPNHETRALRR
jgi:hypothetical protein